MSGTAMKDAIRDTNVSLVRLSLSDDKSEEKALRDKRVAEGLPAIMDATELALAVNVVSREDTLEGDEFLELLNSVQTQEEEYKEAAPTEKLFESEIVVLKEGLALNDDGTANICIITPGWGNSGWYDEKVLKAASDVFSEGLHMYWDHPTVSDEWQRPERSLRDLAGVLAQEAEWRDQGFGGPGLYSTAKVFSPYMESLDEMAPHIGVSVVIYGTSHMGEAPDGNSGEIIDTIVAARSVDFVTLPARGGKVEAKFESLKEGRRIKQLIEGGKGGELVDAAEAKRIQDENEELKQKNESLQKESDGFKDVALKSASDKLVEAALKDVKNLPESARSRIQKRLSERPIVKDGKVDEDGIKTSVEAAVKEEAEYLVELGLDKVTDLGPTKVSEESEDDDEIDEEKYKEGMQKTFESLGLSESAAKIAVAGR